MEYDWGDVSTYSRSIEDLASVYVDFSKINIFYVQTGISCTDGRKQVK
jgi:hypothetical protein